MGREQEALEALMSVAASVEIFGAKSLNLNKWTYEKWEL
jgi:hypothetical protein